MNRFKIQDICKSIMIIVPHQDDEILMSAGLIYEAINNDIDVKVVIVTNGDYESPDGGKGRDRLRESLAGTKIIGLPEQNLLFLGYADTGMPEKESFLMKLYEEKDIYKIYPSACGNETYALEEKPEYHMQKHRVHAKYTRESVQQDLKAVIRDNLPDCIVTTCECDLHGDHKGLFLFVQDVLEELGREISYAPSLYCGLIHSCAGDDIWPDRETPYFSCPMGFENQEKLVWKERYVLKMPDELSTIRKLDNLKYQALSEYKIALEPNAVEFLMSFIKDEEIFWKII